MTISVLIKRFQLDTADYFAIDENTSLTMEEMLESANQQTMKVNLNIKESDIIGYFVHPDTDFNIQLFTSVGNFTVEYTTEMITKLNKIIHE